MTTVKTFALAVCTATLALTPLFADVSDKKTTITIDKPMQIPTTTLQPGTYTLKLMESTSNRHIVTVWDQDGMHLITTILAIPNYRLQPTGESKFTFWETPANQPQALRAWFYPGDNFGQEFAYPKEQAQSIGMVTKTEIPSLSASDEATFGSGHATSESASAVTPAEPAAAVAAAEPAVAAKVTEEPAAATTAVAADPEPTPAPAPVAAAPAREEAPQAQEPAAAAEAPMPATAGYSNELLLIGFLTAIAGMATFLFTGKKLSA
jgi:hypothetical protein